MSAIRNLLSGKNRVAGWTMSCPWSPPRIPPASGSMLSRSVARAPERGPELGLQQVLPGGTLVGGWWRADMMGMLDWYRDCLRMTPRWDDAVVAHADGV
ncbi:hypothetical protein MY1884_002718, partial [Beauveria asiatica]